MTGLAREHHSQGAASAPLEAVLRPLAGCGDDPRYGDDFLFVKQQVDKLQGNDYPEIYRRCCLILAEQAKDLRVAGYLALAALARDAVAGLIEAAEAYRQLLATAWEDCHPRREGARINALAWLNNARFEAMARAAGSQATEIQRTELRQVVDGINQLIRQWVGEDAPQWRALDSWLKAKEKLPVDVAPGNVSAPPPTMPATARLRSLGDDTASTACASTRPMSDRDVFQQTSAISQYLREQGAWLQAMAYTRALRWGGLTLPPTQDGRTRVPAPRASAEASLDQCGDGEALLGLCEGLFLEPGGQFWLDLQFRAWQAAGQLGRQDLTLFVADQIASLLKRLPGLDQLCFEDGRPFAAPATRTWLTELTSEPQETPAAQAVDQWDRQLAEIAREARALAGKKKLAEGLNLLAGLPVASAPQRLRRQLAQAGLCLQGGRADVALPLLDALEREVDDNRLAQWNETLALEVWRLSLEAVQQSLRKATGPAKETLEARARQLRGQICRTDPAAAVAWL